MSDKTVLKGSKKPVCNCTRKHFGNVKAESKQRHISFTVLLHNKKDLWFQLYQISKPRRRYTNALTERKTRRKKVLP
jgi:hypothetical protein